MRKCLIPNMDDLPTMAAMTLILGMSKAEGVYLSVDYRVTRSGDVIDDDAVKSLDIKYPPYKGGPRALMAFTGLAELADGTKMGDWLRETLRGESERFDDSMKHLRERLNRDVGRFQEPLLINALVVHGEKRYFAGLSNVHTTNSGRQRVRGYFGYMVEELDGPYWFANGSGAIAVANSTMADLVSDQMEVRPRDVKDHMNLLASVNRKVAQLDGSVSPYCHVKFLQGSGDQSATSKVFTDHGESVQSVQPNIFLGIDLTGMLRQVRENFRAMKRSEAVDEVDVDTVKDELKRRP